MNKYVVGDLRSQEMAKSSSKLDRQELFEEEARTLMRLCHNQESKPADQSSHHLLPLIGKDTSLDKYLNLTITLTKHTHAL